MEPVLLTRDGNTHYVNTEEHLKLFTDAGWVRVQETTPEPAANDVAKKPTRKKSK